MRLLTGFPGFLGTEFIDRILRKTDAQFLCLVQAKFLNLAHLKLEELEKRNPGAKNRIQLIEGDITVSGLQITNPSLLAEVDQVYHFAAVYDLNVSESLGKLINVDGTRNVLDLLPTLPHLDDF